MYLQHWHGRCHVKLLPSRRKFCVHHTTMQHNVFRKEHETRLRLPQVNKQQKFPPKRVKNQAIPSSIFIFISSSSTGELCSQPIRGNVRRIGRMFLEHVERSFLDPEYSFVAVRRILPTRFAKQKFAQLRTN